MDEKNGFGVADYSVFAGVLVISCGIGLYFSYKGNKSPEEFFMGNRRMHPIPVAMSLLTSVVSSFTVLGYAAEVYANGTQICIILVGIILAIMFSSYLLLPVLHPLKLTSINEYLLLRFKSKELTTSIFLMSVTNLMILGGITLYAATIVLASITKLNTLTNIFLLGIVCTTYSAFGGFRAVIWTDFFQMFVMVLGVIIVVIVGCALKGGFMETLYTASKGGRLEIFNMSLNPFVRHTFFNTMSYGFIVFLRVYGVEQYSVQRIYSVKSVKKAKRVLSFNIFGVIIFMLTIFFSGLVAFANYAGCDPMALGIIEKKDQIMPYFVMDKLSFIPGLQGLYVGAIIGATLSSLSSFINSLVALLWRDVCLKFSFFRTASPMRATLTSKILSLVIGAANIVLAILVSNTKGLLEIIIKSTGAFSGPIVGVFLIGFFLPKCNTKGVWTGFILSYVMALWITIGSIIYKTRTKMLPFSADECDHDHLNFTSLTFKNDQKNFSLANLTTIDENSEDPGNFWIYQMSYTLNGAIGFLICITTAVVVSFITGNQRIEEVSPKYVSPYVHKFYWTKEEIHNIKRNEANLDIENTQKEENNLEKKEENNLEKKEENNLEKKEENNLENDPQGLK